MSRLPLTESRRSKRETTKKRASLVLELGFQLKRLPCLVLDFSKHGYRLRGSFQLKRGQVVELVLDERPSSSEHCSVVWVGQAGSALQGEAGLKCVRKTVS
jgi:hypothetical protein